MLRRIVARKLTTSVNQCAMDLIEEGVVDRATETGGGSSVE